MPGLRLGSLALLFHMIFMRTDCTEFYLHPSFLKVSMLKLGEVSPRHIAGPRHIASVRSMDSHPGLFYSGDTSLDLQIFISQKKQLDTWFQECLTPPPLQLVVLLAFWALA